MRSVARVVFLLTRGVHLPTRSYRFVTFGVSLRAIHSRRTLPLPACSNRAHPVAEQDRGDVHEDLVEQAGLQAVGQVGPSRRDYRLFANDLVAEKIICERGSVLPVRPSRMGVS